jgi:hypothetical protein
MTEASELREEVPEQNISLIQVLINMHILRMLSRTSINVWILLQWFGHY